MPSRKKCSKNKVYRPKYTSCSGRKIKGKCVKRSSKRHSKKSCKRSCKRVCKPSFLVLDIAFQKYFASADFSARDANKDALLVIINQDINKAKEFINLNLQKLIIAAKLSSFDSVRKQQRIELLNTALNAPREAAPSLN